jgi:hypothetical protein
MIPEGWWHQVRTRPGRNAAVTWEFEPYEELLNNFWPADNFGRLWSSQVL